MEPETSRRTETPASSATTGGPTAVERDGETVRGVPWASNLGVVLGGLGLAVMAYSYRWEVLNEPDTYMPAGVNGVFLGAGVLVVGLIIAVMFLLTPPSRPRSSGDAPLDPGAWNRRAEKARARWMLHRTLGWIGAMLFLVGLAFTVYVYRENVDAGSDTESYRLAGIGATFGQWAAVGVLVAVVGLLLWIFGALQSGVHRDAIGGFRAAALGGVAAPVVATDATPLADAPPVAGAPHGPGATVLSNGVREAEVRALMRRLDQMMATLPEETVTAFSRSPEAATYLKLLGDAKK